MNNIPNNELLAILGFDDPPHSLKWYRERYPDIIDRLKNFIKLCLDTEKCFPKGLTKTDPKRKGFNYRYTIEKTYGIYIVKSYNTDRGEVWHYKIFLNIDKAISYFIKNTSTAAGSIKDYWKIKL